MAELKKLGRYELRRVLGKGAMGVVYEGYDPTLSRRVAVKTILKSVAHDEETERDYAARFEREAKAVARLNHPHIVQVHDFGVENDVAYLVMEFIQGRELRSFFIAGERFEPAETVRIMGELLDALDFAHEAGVIHRDVKPANVMLDAQRRVKLADFGVARLQDTERSAAGTMVGTPAFMSPEQISGGKVDRRTDIFSAGTILYQLLTGEQPFKGEGAWTIAKQIMQDDPPAPSSVIRSVSPVFDDIVHKALAKNPSLRYAKARDFAASLRGARGGPAAEPETQARGSEAEVEFWRSIQASSDPSEFEVYLQEFPQGTYAGLARIKLARLRGPQAATGDVAEEKARLEAEAAAKAAALEKTGREAAEKAKREAEEKEQARQAQVRQQQEAAARRRAATQGDATVAMGGSAVAASRDVAGRKPRAIPAIVALLLVAGGAAAYLFLSRKPPPAPVAEAPPAPPKAEAPAPPPAPAKVEVSAAELERIRREAEDRVRREYADKSAAEQAAAAKAAAEKAAQEKLLALKAAAAEKAAADKAAKEKAATEQAQAARTNADKAAAERVAVAKAAEEKAAAERLAAEKTAAAKAAAAGRPGWPNVGDRWVYEVRDVRRPEQRYEAAFEIKSVTPAAIVEGFSAPGLQSIESRYGAGAFLFGIAPGVVNFSPYLRAFQELQPGQRWSGIEYRYMGACSTDGSLTCGASARIVGKEKVSVRAGSFDAWRIEVELLQGVLPGRGTVHMNRGAVLFTYWYAEDVKRVVRYRSRALDMWAQPEVEMELLSYAPAAAK